MQLTFRGAARFIPDLDGPRPAAEAHGARQRKNTRALSALPVVLMAVVAAGCGAARPPTLPDLSGRYLFTRANYEGDTPVRGIPLLPLRDVLDDSTVHVKVVSEINVLVEYTDRDGVPCVDMVKLTDETVTWDHECITATVKGPFGVPIAPGLARERLSARLSRDCNGCLVVEWSYSEIGLALFIIPFRDAYSGKAVLQPISSISSKSPSESEVRW